MNNYSSQTVQCIDSNVLAARYEAAPAALRIVDLSFDDPIILAEARRWTTGPRGPSVASEALDGVDLSAFVRHGLAVGVHAIAAAGNAQDKLEFAQLVEDLGVRTGQAAEQAAAHTAVVVNEATATLQRAADDARRTLLDAQQAARKDFADQVSSARSSIEQELTRAFGGDDPALLTRLRPLLDKFGAELQRAGVDETRKLVEQTGRLFDADDPTSPMAKHALRLRSQQAESESAQERRGRELETKITELSTVVERAFAGREAADRLRQQTTAKGIPYEDAVHPLMHTIAAGLGDSYEETGTRPGAVSRSKKGDGVIRMMDEDAAVVLEMTSGDRRDWADYLDGAERNREAQASLGLVPDSSLINGQTMLCLSHRRIVMAFDPEVDDPALLRTVVQLLRLSARQLVRQRDGGSVDAVEEKLDHALAQLDSIAGIQKSANLARNHAQTVCVQVDALRENLERLLTQAKTALSAVEPSAALEAA